MFHWSQPWFASECINLGHAILALPFFVGRTLQALTFLLSAFFDWPVADCLQGLDCVHPQNLSFHVANQMTA